jgi:predicted sugar kinase
MVLEFKSKTFKKKEKEMKQAILQALEDRYNAQISEADATIKIYLENSVGIGEHPQHIDEVDKLIEKIANAQEKLKELQAFKL